MKDMNMSFSEREASCVQVFSGGGPYWHLYTPGIESKIIFACEEEFRAGMNILAWNAAKFPDVGILTFELMNNHVHFILSGRKDRCLEFFECYRRRLQFIYTRNRKYADFSKFTGNVLEITDLKSLRNEIVYVNRNGYVVNPQCTPYSYPWGAGAVFFNPFLRHLMRNVPLFSDMTVITRRQIVKSKKIKLPKGYRVFEGIIIPSSYCMISEAENLFRNAHHYFTLLSKNFESYSDIAKSIADNIFLTDSEMYGAISAFCHKNYGIRNPNLLTPEQKLETARKMCYDYRASNRQIRNILKLEASAVDALFPKTH